MVYLFSSPSPSSPTSSSSAVFQDNSQSLLSYTVAYYLRHFDEVCFGSCLFESLFCFSSDVFFFLFLRNPSRAFFFSSLLLPEETVWLILYQIIYLFSFRIYGAETNLTPPPPPPPTPLFLPPLLALFSLLFFLLIRPSVFHPFACRSTLGLCSFKTCSLLVGTASKGALV